MKGKTRQEKTRQTWKEEKGEIRRDKARQRSKTGSTRKRIQGMQKRQKNERGVILQRDARKESRTTRKTAEKNAKKSFERKLTPKEKSGRTLVTRT